LWILLHQILFCSNGYRKLQGLTKFNYRSLLKYYIYIFLVLAPAAVCCLQRCIVKLIISFHFECSVLSAKVLIFIECMSRHLSLPPNDHLLMCIDLNLLLKILCHPNNDRYFANFTILQQCDLKLIWSNLQNIVQLQQMITLIRNL